MIKLITHMRLRTSLPLIISVVAIIAAVSTGVTSYAISRTTLDTAAKEKLEALAASRLSGLDMYMDSIR